MRSRASAAAVALLLVAPVAAAAQDDGITVDPDSPSGKEYAIPLEEARRSAGSGDRRERVRPGERSSPLFGAGVDPEPRPATESAPSSGGADRSKRKGKRERSSAKDAKNRRRPQDEKRSIPSPVARPTAERLAATRNAEEGDADTLLVGGIGIGVLGLGALIGIAGRRRLR